MFEVIADKRPQLELALLFVGGNRRVEIGGIPTYQPHLPGAEPLGCRQVDVEEVRVNFWPACDGVKLNTPDGVRGQVPSVAGVAKREALIERVRTIPDLATSVDVAAELIADAEVMAEIPGQLSPKIRIEQAALVDRVVNAEVHRNHRRGGQYQSSANNRPGGRPNQDGDIV